MIPRQAEKELRSLAKQFKTVVVIGPRQSGKTTLVRNIFSEKPYANLENPDTRLFAIEDPRGFLANYPEGAVLDEIQRTPDLLSYLQQILDEANKKGLFILTGSNNFLMQERISQSLAGRAAYLNLLPFSTQEISDKLPDTLSEYLLRGNYPVLYKEKIDAAKWYANYIRTYIERDVRLIKNISNLIVFERFLRLCAGRIGHLLNMNNLAVETGVDNKTISAWMGILESSFVAFRLRPHFKNFNKRIVKMPKLYFYDTGLACALLGIKKADQLDLHPIRGNLFENMVIFDFLKRRYNAGLPNNLYFWRDNIGHEIDLILDNAGTLTPIEIKSGQTITRDYFKGLEYWNKISNGKGGYVIYGGQEEQLRSSGIKVIPYRKIHKL